MQNTATRVAMIGVGGMARAHLKRMLTAPEKNQVIVISEPSPEQYETTAKLFQDFKLEPPPNEPDVNRLLKDYDGKLDAAFIVTPHVYHFEQARLFLNAGMDVLLEKPMVMNAKEAEDLIATRDRTGRHLVVAFNGSLSTRIRRAVDLLRSGEMGTLQSISATVWQGWGKGTAGLWRQDPVISGGGFMFDTGAHMLNTVCDLAGEEFVEVAAWLDNLGRPVDIIGVVMGRLASGALVTMHGSGETIRTWRSDVRVFCSEAIIHTGVWGEYLEIQRNGEEGYTPVEFVDPPSPWDQFVSVRSGLMPNPSPPEVGLRMAKLWDAIQASARQGGIPVKV
jgi:predicted dehydrogenase